MQQTITVELRPSVRRSLLLGTVVRVQNAKGDKIGAGYVHTVTHMSGERLAIVRASIGGEVYTGSLNWDHTRRCVLQISTAPDLTIVAHSEI